MGTPLYQEVSAVRTGSGMGWTEVSHFSIPSTSTLHITNSVTKTCKSMLGHTPTHNTCHKLHAITVPSNQNVKSKGTHLRQQGHVLFSQAVHQGGHYLQGQGTCARRGRAGGHEHLWFESSINAEGYV